MSRLQLVLLALFILGLVGAVNSVTNLSTLEKEKGFINGVLSLIGLNYEPEPEPAREFDFVPGKVTSEVSRLTPESLKATPSARPAQSAQSTTASPGFSTQPKKPFSSPSPSPLNQFNFTFTNEIPIPPINPNGQTLGLNTNNTPPIPPVSPSQNSPQSKSRDIIDTILKILNF